MARTIDEILAGLSEAERADAIGMMTAMDQKLERRKHDADLAESLIRVLKSPGPQAQRLRELITDVVRMEIRQNG